MATEDIKEGRRHNGPTPGDPGATTIEAKPGPNTVPGAVIAVLRRAKGA